MGRCSRCSALVVRGDQGCKGAFEELLAREYSDFRWAQLRVDDRRLASRPRLGRHVSPRGCRPERWQRDVDPYLVIALELANGDSSVTDGNFAHQYLWSKMGDDTIYDDAGHASSQGSALRGRSFLSVGVAGGFLDGLR